MKPASIAREPSLARSSRRDGAIAPMPPIWMPIDAKLAKPREGERGQRERRPMSTPCIRVSLM